MTLKRPQMKSSVLFDESYINAAEAANYLRISRQRFYNLTHKKRVPHFKFGKKILVKREDLNSLLVKIEVNDPEPQKTSGIVNHTEVLLDRRRKNSVGKRF